MAMGNRTQEQFNRIAMAIVFEDTQHGNALRNLYGQNGHRLYSIDKEKATEAFRLANEHLKTFF